MKTPDPLKSAHYRWRRFRAAIFSAVAVCVIGLAVIVGVGRLLVPYADELRPMIEQRLSEQGFGQVTIEEVQASWPGFFPSIALRGLSIEQGTQAPLTLELVVMEVRWFNVFRKDHAVANLALVGSQITLAQHADGQWVWQFQSSDDASVDLGRTTAEGPVSSVPGDGVPTWLGLSLRDTELVFQPSEQPEVALTVTEADFSKLGSEYRLSGWLASSNNAGQRVRFRLWMAQSDGRWTKAQAWLNAEQVSLGEWLGQAGWSLPDIDETALSMEVWLDWDETTGGTLDTVLSLDGSQGRLRGTMKAKRWPNEVGERSWAVEVQALTLDRQPIVTEAAWSRTAEGQAMAADYMDLSALHQIIDPWMSRWSGWPEDLSGQVNSLELGADLAGHFHHAEGGVDAFGMALNDGALSLSELDLALDLAGDQLVIHLDGQPALSWPETIQAPVVSEFIDGAIFFSPTRLFFDGLQLVTADVEAKVDGAVYLAGQRPFLDLLIQAPTIAQVDVRPFLPHRIIPPPALRWLNDALVFMGQASGEALLHFPVGLRTREFQAGNFSAEVNFEDLELAYARGWPVASAVQGRATFLGQGLDAQVDKAQIGSFSLSAPHIRIDRFVEPRLDLRLVGQEVEADALARALATVPISGWDTVFGAVQWGGDVDADVGLTLPIKNRAAWAMTGFVDFLGNDLALTEVSLGLERLEGRLALNRQLIQSDGLQALFYGQPVTLRPRITSGPSPQLTVSTTIQPQAWLAQLDGFSGLADYVSGQTELSVEVSKAPAQDGLRVALNSSLGGTELAFPAPLAKPSLTEWPLAIEWVVQANQSAMRASLGEIGAMSIARRTNGWAAAASFGNQQVPQLPMDAGVVFDGSLPDLDLGGWQQLITEGINAINPEGVSQTDWINDMLSGRVAGLVEVDALNVPGTAVAPAAIEINWAESQWIVSVQGPSIRGEILWPGDRGLGRAIVVDLEHLYLVPNELEPETSPIRPPTLTDPRQAIPLTLLVRALYWDDLVLGSTRLETHSTDQGWEIELLDIDGPDLRLQARGDWSYVDDLGPRSAMQGRLSSRNFNRLIQATGYQAGLQARQATLDFDLNWPGTLLDFNLYRVNGSMDFTLRGGNIPQASAGAGRLLGLVSFSALPRRLMLDFRDVFSSGFQFDRMEGQFDMTNGQAQTQGIEIASPSAIITLTGTTDMIARSYDQQVVIEPGLGSTLPVIGGLAGGPVGAAAGLLLQSILDQPLKGVSEARYSITGPWAEPLIELVDAQIVRADDTSEPRSEQPLLNEPTTDEVEMMRPPVRSEDAEPVEEKQTQPPPP